MVDTDCDSPSRSRLTVQTERTVVDVDDVDDIKKPTISSSLTTPFSPEQLAEALNAVGLHP